MKLLGIALENYQGIKNLALSFNGESCRIYGENATGKTTVLNSISYLLTGKPLDEQSVKGYTPKPVNGEGGESHNLNSVVSALLELDDGSQVELSKTFHEVWKKRRGRSELEYSGNTVDYAINGVPTKEKDYNSFVERAIGDVDTVRMLMVPEFFLSTMDWKKRRAKLMEIVGNLTDDDVIDANPKLSELDAYLTIQGGTGRYTVDEYRKIATAQRTKLNRRLDTLPDLINEAKRAIPDLPEGLTAEVLTERIGAKQKELDGLRSQLSWQSMATRPPQQSAAERKLAELQQSKADAKLNYQKSESARYASVTAKLRRMDTDICTLDNAIFGLGWTIPDLERQRSAMDALRTQILTEYQKVRATHWDESSEICPTCGQRLTADKIAQHRADFNQQKSTKLTALAQRGKREANKDMIADLDKRIAECKENLAQKQQARDTLTQERDTLGQSIVTKPFEETKLCQGYDSSIAQAQAEVQAEASNQITIDTNNLTDSIGRVGTELEALLKQKAQLDASIYQAQRVEELEQEQEDTAVAFGEVERGLYLCEEFIRAKVGLIDTRINQTFQTIRFKLFEEQQNGGLKECCEALIPSPSGAMVAYANANTAAKVNGALEVINALGEQIGTHLPVLVDGCESVTKLVDVDLQVIATVVAGGERFLTMSPKAELEVA